MYIDERLRTELDFFKRTNEHFEIQAGKSTCKVVTASDDILYMAMSASLVMDCTEDGFFENFVITDTVVSGQTEMLIDAYAFLETDNPSVKQLHVFQYKLFKSGDKAASPVELLNFITFINNNFVHPDLVENDVKNPVIKEIKKQFDSFLNSRRGRRIEVSCHFITNAKGVTKANESQINDVVMGRFLRDRQLFGFSIQVNGVNDIIELATNGIIRVGSETLEMIIDHPQNSYRLEDNSQQTGLGLPTKVIICLCNINEFIRLQNKYHHNQLYTDNIRLYLGDRGSVNKDIIATITSNESIWFPYMNNGISIICDKLTIGTVNTTRNTQSLILENMQIINGCQTINALYHAKYNDITKDNFRAASVLVRIYEIDSRLVSFKMNIIKATNNQNVVKSFSLMANDPIQIKIAEVLKHFDIIYDRKGESKQNPNKKTLVISMTTAAIAYRAVYLFMARSLRSGLGKSRVFMKGEYEKVFDYSLLEEENNVQFIERCIEILIASVILDTVRDLIVQYAEQYATRLPIIRKSAYHIAGFVYANGKKDFDSLRKSIIEIFLKGNDTHLRSMDYPQKVREIVEDVFLKTLDKLEELYNGLQNVEKLDVDNLLKDNIFEREYSRMIEKIIG